MKYYGKIGYFTMAETAPGVWQEGITERSYRGDIIKQQSNTTNGEWLNDNLKLSNKLSILADQFAYANFNTIRYVEWLSSKWKVSSVEVQPPRLILTLGEVYNEQT